jgi:signal recognition particle subunit SRP54
MVLGSLSCSLNNALEYLHKTTVVNEEVLDRILSEICRALLEADVNIHLVKQLRENIK